MDNEEIQAKIEAALYAAGRPLSPEELAKAAGIISKKRAISSAQALQKRVNAVLKAVEVVQLSERRFVMQLKQNYTQIARKFATKSLLSNSTLRTLSFIVYFQPVSAHEIVTRRGSQAYQHLRQLEQLGFVTGEASGRTKIYKTTSIFAEYFGLSHDIQLMKQQLTRLQPQI